MFAAEGFSAAEYIRGCKALLMKSCSISDSTTEEPVISEEPFEENEKSNAAKVTPESIKASCGDDYLLKMFADCLLDKLVSNDEKTSSHMSIIQSRLKSVLNLLEVLNKDKPVSQELDYYICGSRFIEVTDAVKVLSMQTSSNNIGISIGLCLQKIVLLKISHALENNNPQAEAEGNEFKELMKTQWNLKVISKVKERRSVSEVDSGDVLPSAEDLLRLIDWSKERCQEMMEVSEML